jgi:polyisoprenoid-binding protein YceI
MRPHHTLAALLLGGLASTSVLAADYRIDPSHAFIQFRISHLGFSTLVGRFNQFEGRFTWDAGNPGKAQVQVKIDPASIDTNWAERDKHLRGEDFLDVGRFPTAGFVSTAYEGDAKGGLLKGELTLHGVTRPIVIQMQAIGEGLDPWGNYRAGFAGTTEIRRADFGMGFDLGPTAETMQFELHLEGLRQKTPGVPFSESEAPARP